MSALRGWFRGGSGRPSSSGSSPVASSSSSVAAVAGGNERSPAEQEVLDMEDAMAAAALILNDNIDGAEARLREHKDRSAFHQLGLSVAIFMCSVLGFEKDIMAEATNRLFECEARSLSDMRKAQKTAGGNGSSSAPAPAPPSAPIFPPGTEFALVHAETQLMLAVVSVLHESLTEAIKGFYKLRKAFIALNEIMETEARLLGGRDAATTNGLHHNHTPFSEDVMPGSFDDAEFVDLESNSGSGEDTALGGSDSSPRTAAPAGAQEKPPASDLSGAAAAAASASSTSVAANRGLADGSRSAVFTHPIDVFVHSGANMCFGMLMLMISMVPPAFSRLLSIIGFKGDRSRGVQMLWQSTKFANINGGMAGMVLLAYYNGLVGYSDILPTDADVRELSDPGEIVGYPRDRCRDLLAHMKTLYPDNMMWRLEEARALATHQRADEAVKILSNQRDGRMLQITALTKFELALNAMCVMEWQLMRDTFVQCVELNNWSHAMYYYNAGCAELEMYRDAFHEASLLARDPSKSEKQLLAEAAAARHKKVAESYLRQAPKMAGKKKFMARQMPFDAFVTRKLAKWEERAKALNVDLVHAIGASPAQEMVYLWNGSKRMPPALLEKALACLAWERCTATSSTVVENFQSAPDESAIASLCRVSLLRSLRRFDEARKILQEEVLSHDRSAFKGPTKDDYILPAGYYEAAVLCWCEACDTATAASPSGADAAETPRQKKINECLSYLEKVASWEAFILDARIGMRVQTALDTIRWIKQKKHWA